MTRFLQILRTKWLAIAWRDWCVYGLVIVSYVGLLAVIREVHWHFAFRVTKVSADEHGRGFGVCASVGSPNPRHYYYRYDDKFNLSRIVRLENIKLTNAHGLSPDGRYLVGVGDELQFEIVSLASDQPPIIVPFADDYKSTYWDITHTYNPTGLYLVGKPPYSILVSSARKDVWLIDHSGSIQDKIRWKADMNARVHSKSLAACGNFHTTAIECYSIDKKFTLLHQEEVSSSNPQTLRQIPEISSKGRIAIQCQNDVRIVDFNESDPSKREMYISWPSAAGKLEAISDSGDKLLLRDNRGERMLMSIDSGLVLARSNLVNDDWYIGYATFFDEDKLLFSKTEKMDEAVVLGTWDWKTGALVERELRHYSRGVEIGVKLLLLAAVAFWAVIFLRYAVKHSKVYFGMGLVLAMFAMLLFWLYTKPFITYWQFGIDVPGTIQAVFVWQLTLSLIGLWVFRRLSFTVAACTLLCVSCCACQCIGLNSPEFILFWSMVIVFAVTMSGYQLGLNVRNTDRKKLSIADIMILMLTTAIFIWWCKSSDMPSLEHLRTGSLASGAGFGIVHCVAALIASALSKVQRPRVYWFVVPAAVIYGIACYQFTRNVFVGEPAFWPGFTILCLCQFIAIWPILSFVEFYLERPISNKAATSNLVQ